ncbi:unnamed protein product [Sphenostylis stenocarpa]|uniref:Uncharacterized protein n=1 Tax=Sphenostylis stenocarpa TaxID=92480 RepID=A0AA86V4U2_9FABA|nr:unnamed protein product [Sphenostylis stenocarpa]
MQRLSLSFRWKRQPFNVIKGKKKNALTGEFLPQVLPVKWESPFGRMPRNNLVTWPVFLPFWFSRYHPKSAFMEGGSTRINGGLKIRLRVLTMTQLGQAQDGK